MNAAEKQTAGAIVKRAMRLPFAHQLRFARRLATDARVPLRARVPLLVLLLYLAMPLDIIPDFIPVIGHLDDLLVAAIAVWWFVRTCPPGIALEQLDVLERTALGRFDKFLPWGLMGVCAFAGAIVVALLVLRRR